MREGEAVLSEAKNRQISETRQLTIQRHKSMACKTYELKVDRSHLSEKTLNIFERLFLEAKWFYNDMLAKGVFKAQYKVTAVQVKVKDRFEDREILCLSSQMRQEIIDRAKDSTRALSALKGKGRKVGALKFKSHVFSIPLKQYGVTYELKRGSCVRIQGAGRPMKVRGLGQIPKGAELASATLEQRDGDYFLHVTTYQNIDTSTPPRKAVGVDAGVKHQLTLSNGLQVDEAVSVTRRAIRLHRELSRRKRWGRNWSRTKARLNREYGHIVHQRADLRHKIVSRLTSTYDCIAVQDDSISGWQRMWGRRVATSAIGGIMSDLKTRARTPVAIDRFEPTTQRCSSCGALKQIGLEERVYLCDACGLRIDRDLNSAINDWKEVPAERRELTPVDTKAATEMMGYFNSIPSVLASLVEEAGSHRTFGRW